jgi:hypothetical protein
MPAVIRCLIAFFLILIVCIANASSNCDEATFKKQINIRTCILSHTDEDGVEISTEVEQVFSNLTSSPVTIYIPTISGKRTDLNVYQLLTEPDTAYSVESNEKQSLPVAGNQLLKLESHSRQVLRQSLKSLLEIPIQWAEAYEFSMYYSYGVKIGNESIKSTFTNYKDWTKPSTSFSYLRLLKPAHPVPPTGMLVSKFAGPVPQKKCLAVLKELLNELEINSCANLESFLAITQTLRNIGANPIIVEFPSENEAPGYILFRVRDNEVLRQSNAPEAGRKDVWISPGESFTFNYKLTKIVDIQSLTGNGIHLSVGYAVRPWYLFVNRSRFHFVSTLSF